MSIVSDQSTEKRSENLTRKKDEKSCMKKISRALQGIMDKGRNTPDKIQTSRVKKQALSWSKLASKQGIMVLWSNASCIRSEVWGLESRRHLLFLSEQPFDARGEEEEWSWKNEGTPPNDHWRVSALKKWLDPEDLSRKKTQYEGWGVNDHLTREAS